MATLRIDIRLSPGFARAALTGALLAVSARTTESETLTLSTYYPAPLGVYREVITTGAGGSAHTLLARDGSSVGVALGGTAPAEKLHVGGKIRANSDIYSSGGYVYAQAPTSGSYAQTELRKWGLYSPGTMYIEPGSGSNLILWDSSNNYDAKLDVRMVYSKFATGPVGIGDIPTEPTSTAYKYLYVGGTAGCRLKTASTSAGTTGCTGSGYLSPASKYYATWVPGVYIEGEWRNDRHVPTIGGDSTVTAFRVMQGCSSLTHAQRIANSSCWKQLSYDARQTSDVKYWCCPRRP